MGERRQFQMHEKLLLDVIKRQAGSLEKAVLEGVMNSIEAGAEKAVEVELDNQRLVISDDGRGFRDRGEIESWFETFGQPHDESEGKTWAQFRMGRGQLFAFGRNSWRSNQFGMRVDIEGKGLGYDLTEDEEVFAGCRVEVDLYRPLGDSDVWRVVQEIERFVKWVEVPVRVNGKQVNTPASKGKWGKDSTEDAWVRLSSGETSSSGIDVYNLGVLVMTIPRWEHGVGGVIVSRKRLDVNFARNDVIRSCPVWRRITRILKSHSTVKKVSRKKKLSADERTSLIRKMVSGEESDLRWGGVPLLVDASGHPWTMDALQRCTKFKKWTIGPANVMSDKLIQQEICLVLDEEVVKAFGFPPGEGFLSWFWGKIHRTTLCDQICLQWSTYEDATKTISMTHRIVPEDNWTMGETRWIMVLREMEKVMQRYKGGHRRKIFLGESQVAAAWTDGQTYVTFERGHLHRYSLMKDGRAVASSVIALTQVMAHELCHDEDSRTQVHTPHFYRDFHELRDGITWTATSILNWLQHKGMAELQAKVDRAMERKKKRKAREAEARRKKVAREAKAKPKAKKKAKASPPRGEAAAAAAPKGERSPEQDAYESHRGNGGTETWSAIEERLGLKPTRGMAAYRLAAKWKRKLEAGS
jgi:hypothetical protein